MSIKGLIKEINVLKLEPGDVIVFRTSYMLPNEMNHLSDVLRKGLQCKGVKIILAPPIIEDIELIKMATPQDSLLKKLGGKSNGRKKGTNTKN